LRLQLGALCSMQCRSLGQSALLVQSLPWQEIPLWSKINSSPGSHWGLVFGTTSAKAGTEARRQSAMNEVRANRKAATAKDDRATPLDWEALFRGRVEGQ
jgi:hypothetical protein